MFVKFAAGRTPRTLQAPAEKSEFCHMRTGTSWPLSTNPAGMSGSPGRLQPRFYVLQELTGLSALQRLKNALPSHLSGGFRIQGGIHPFHQGLLSTDSTD